MTAALLQQLRTTFLGDNERNHTWTGGMRAYRAFLEVLRGRFESRGTPSTDRTDAATYKSRRCGVRAGAGGNPRGVPCAAWEPGGAAKLLNYR